QAHAPSRNGLRIEDDDAVGIGPGVVARLADEALADVAGALPATVKGDVHLAPSGPADLRHVDEALLVQADGRRATAGIEALVEALEAPPRRTRRRRLQRTEQMAEQRAGGIEAARVEKGRVARRARVARA